MIISGILSYNVCITNLLYCTTVRTISITGCVESTIANRKLRWLKCFI